MATSPVPMLPPSTKARRIVTPEGVPLTLEIASAGLRFAALLIDLALMVLVLIAATWLLTSLAFANLEGSGLMLIVWLLGAFVLRNGWFMLFELGPRAATPGKRIVGIRVVARNGGRLDVASVVARNLVREMELFLPISFIAGAAGEDMVSGALATLGLLWTLGMSFFLLFNRDRMRLGDLIGGTWVVLARRRRIAADLTHHAAPAVAAIQFTAEELGVYGIYELQELERVLRGKDRDLVRTVADTIRRKIGRPLIGDDREFLLAYYAQLKSRLERDLLFGKRRANKYEVSA